MVRKTFAISLVELLVVIAIVLVLTGLILSVYLVGKDRARVVVDTSNLHQLGLAGAIYASDYDDVPPLSTLQLFEGGYVQSDILASPTDLTADGLAVQFRRDLRLPVDAYTATGSKFSYIGPGEGDWTFDFYRKRMGDVANQGWLVDLTRSDDKDSGLSMSEGTYRRLLFDTSVIVRSMGAEVLDVNGAISRSVEFKKYFGDFEVMP